jgi:carbonic anhydrase
MARAPRWQEPRGCWQSCPSSAPGAATTLEDVSNLDDLLSNNTRFAASDLRERQPAIPFIPNKQVYVLTCIDPRVDPSDVLGLALGDAIVARTVGGRVTPAVLQDLAWISYLHEVKTPDAEWFELAVVHHTDCGSALLADEPLRREFVHRTGYDDAGLAALAVLDPAATVPGDVAAIVSAPQVSGRIRVSGYAYDVKTGLVTRITPPRSRDGG